MLTWVEVVYLIDMLELRANILLFPQSLMGSPVGRREDDFVWPGNTAAETEFHSYLCRNHRDTTGYVTCNSDVM